jgi:hypothetical protein
MSLGTRGKDRINGKTVDALFTPTETVAGSSEEISEKKIGRPKGGAAKPKTFALPLELNQRLRRFAFEHECKEVDVVRTALTEYLDAHQ